jgi:lysophospholipase L1-like esterase
LIVFEGDSQTYGLDASSEGSTAHEINNSNQPRSPRPFPETLQTMLGRRVRVENHGFPGDRSIDGVYRWVDPSTPALTVLMYGTNDGDVRAPTARQVPVSEFRAALTLMVERRLATGSRVVIMPPPPLGAWDRSAAIEPYRVAARQVARAEGVFLVEPASILSNVNQPFTPDSVHLTPAANDAIAAYFSKVIDVRS